LGLVFARASFTALFFTTPNFFFSSALPSSRHWPRTGKMFNPMQFHAQNYPMPSMQQQHSDMLTGDRAFPSPITNSSLDSPPNSNPSEAKNTMQPFPHMSSNSSSSPSSIRVYDHSYTPQPSQTQPRQIVFKQHRPRQESQDHTWHVGSAESNASSYGALAGDNIVSPGSTSAYEDEAQQKK
jgi:hypothetical protein